MEQSGSVSALKSLHTETGCIWYVDDPNDPDETSSSRLLREQGLLEGAEIEGIASAGRGNTFFIQWHGRTLVLRYYRRGGLVRHVSDRRYLFSGMQNTRAYREFQVLMHLQTVGLPSSRPFACQVIRSGLTYTASMITYRIQGETLTASLLQDDGLSSVLLENEALWRSIGHTIARFHKAGIYHADLNAHNIMLDDNADVYLIDFDRARIRTQPAINNWCLTNMRRLEVSLKKITKPWLNSGTNRKHLEQAYGWSFEQWKTSMLELDETRQ